MNCQELYPVRFGRFEFVTDEAKFDPDAPTRESGVSASDDSVEPLVEQGLEAERGFVNAPVESAALPSHQAISETAVKHTVDVAETLGKDPEVVVPPRTVTRRESWKRPTLRNSKTADAPEGSVEAPSTVPQLPDLGNESLSFNQASSAPEPAGTPREVPVPSVVRARARGEIAALNPVMLQVEGLTKTYGSVRAADAVSFEVRSGSFTGVVGPNGAGKTTVLSMVSGLNRPTAGRVSVNGIDVWTDAPAAKRIIGTLPDRLRLFDRLTGAQLMLYSGVLHGLSEATVAARAQELAQAFGLESALDRTVADYSTGMQKKIGLACALIHSPEILVLDEPFETIDPVSASTVTEILEKFVAGGGSVIMSSHSLDLIQRVCDHVVVIFEGAIVAQGTVDDVRQGQSLEQRFVALTQQPEHGKGMEWLHDSGASA